MNSNLFMCCKHRNGTMKSKLFGSAAFENRIIKTMIAGNIYYDINILIVHKLFDRFMEIERRDKIKFGLIVAELISEPCPFFPELFIQRHMYLAVHIYNMKFWFKEIQHSF